MGPNNIVTCVPPPVYVCSCLSFPTFFLLSVSNDSDDGFGFDPSFSVITRDACVSDDVLLNDLEDKEDGWWRDEGWKSSISVDTTWKIPNIVLSEELRVKMHG